MSSSSVPSESEGGDSTLSLGPHLNAWLEVAGGGMGMAPMESTSTEAGQLQCLYSAELHCPDMDGLCCP